jgi:hypothetical protein
MHSNRAFYPIWLLSLSLLFIVIILPLTRQGMFLDGIIYAAIAKNLSLGQGSLWQPFYSATHFPLFYEHPPLALYFQSLFFKLFGQGFGVERFYSFLMAFGQFALIGWYWLKKEKAAFISLGLLLFLWLLIPLNHMYVNNMLEGTLTLFTTLASLLLVIQAQSFARLFSLYFTSSIAILIAFFCNGPTAFFPLAIPFLYSLLNERGTIYIGIKNTFLFALVLTSVFIGFYWWVPDALTNTQKYFEQQLLAAVIGGRQLDYVGLNHLHIVKLYLRAFWPVTLFALLCITVAAKINKRRVLLELKAQFSKKPFLLFFLLSLISSLPIGVSHRQAFNYIMQSAPFFTLAMMWVCFLPFQTIAAFCTRKKKLFKGIAGLSFLVFAGSFITVLVLANGYNRNKTMLEDIRYLTHYCKNNEIISVSPGIYYNWYTGAYFSRLSMISITPESNQPYFLALKNEAIPPNYHTLDAPLAYYTLAHHE